MIITLLFTIILKTDWLADGLGTVMLETDYHRSVSLIFKPHSTPVDLRMNRCIPWCIIWVNVIPLQALKAYACSHQFTTCAESGARKSHHYYQCVLLKTWHSACTRQIVWLSELQFYESLNWVRWLWTTGLKNLNPNWQRRFSQLTAEHVNRYAITYPIAVAIKTSVGIK